MSKIEMRLTGSGGQGLILAGIIFAEAALLDGKNSIQSQSYGPEARGGASKAEVIIKDSEIDFPKIEVPDILLSLTQVAYDKYHGEIKESGTMIIDETIDEEDVPEGVKLIKAPILSTATNKVGKSIVANIVAIGLITGLTNIVSRESIQEAVLARVPKGTEELNKSALQAGYDLAESLK